MAYQLRNVTNSNLGEGADKNVVVYDGTYWWAGGNLQLPGSEIMLFSFDGTTITLLDGVSYANNIEAMVHDGTYLHFILGLTLYAIQRTGTNIGGTIDTHGIDAAGWSIAYDGAYIYTGNASGRVHALSFDGANYTEHDDIDLAGATNVFDIVCSGGVIYAVTNGTVHALTFDGATLTNNGDTGAILTTGYALAHDGTYLHVGGTDAGGADLESFTYAGGVFTAAATINVGAAVRGLVHDGTYLHAFCDDGTIRSYTHNGTAYTQAASATVAGVLKKGAHNATYLMVPSENNNVYAVQMSLRANISATPRSGIAPLTVNFTAS